MNRTCFIPLFALAVTLIGCSGRNKIVEAAPETVRGFRVHTVQRVSIPEGSDALGTVRAAQTAQLSAQIVAAVVTVKVAEGAGVRRGDVLVILDGAQQRASVEGANAAVAAAKDEIAAAEADYTLTASTLKRYESLYEKKSVSPHEMEEVQARAKAAAARRSVSQSQLAQAEATLAQARTADAYTRVLAPFDGVVTAKLVDAGAMATPGLPLLIVEDTRKFRLEVAVDESKIADVRLGENVPVSLDALKSAEFQAKVVQIVPAADPGSRSFLVKLELPADARIRSGLFGRAVFAHGMRQSIVVPRTSIITRGQLQAAYVLGNDNIADLRYVTVGREAGDQVEVLSGLQPGDHVVSVPGETDLAGKRVEN